MRYSDVINAQENKKEHVFLKNNPLADLRK
jgi:hypothetical protein